MAALNGLIRAQGRRRDAALKAIGSGVGLEQVRNLDVSRVKAYGDMPLFNHRDPGSVSNAMKGLHAGLHVMLFDYAYDPGADGVRSMYDGPPAAQTVALFPLGAPGLPAFALAPKRMTDRIQEFAHGVNINFAEDADFSRMYALKGEDQVAIRAAFPAEVRAFLLKRPGWSVEVRDAHAAIYRADSLCPAAALAGFLDEAMTILRAVGCRAEGLQGRRMP